MINDFINEEIEIMQFKIEFFKEVATIIEKKNEIIAEFEQELSQLRLKYLNILAISKQLEVVEDDDFYNILEKNKEIVNYSENEEFINDWVFTFEEAEEFIKKY